GAANGGGVIIHLVALGYCFIGLSAITARFFRSMENVVSHSRVVEEIDPVSNTKIVKREKIWNFAIADISLLAFGTSFPQISLATIDAIRNVGNLYAGGLGPGTLVGSAAFDLFPIHAVCVVVPRAGELKKVSDIGLWLVELLWSFWAYIWLYIILEVWTPKVITLWEALITVLQYGLLLLHAYAQDRRIPYLSLPLPRSERPDDWVPSETAKTSRFKAVDDEIEEEEEEEEHSSRIIVDVMIPLLTSFAVGAYDKLLDVGGAEICDGAVEEEPLLPRDLLWIWKAQFKDAFSIEAPKSNREFIRFAKACWALALAPWRILFAFVPPPQIAHGWIAFISSLIFITGIAYVVTWLTDQISASTGIDPYVIALTALAAGTSWPDLVASKIAAERQITADSALANITCSNSVNIFVGIGLPWLVDAGYNFFAYGGEALRVEDADHLSFSLGVFFATSAGCVGVLVLRRLTLGAELGGPKVWAWLTGVYFMSLWVVFVVLSALRVSDYI
ncbi:hypothetical protein M569_03962, partial [Genlisea aurea]